MNSQKRKTVCVMGMGFVGMASAIAVASCRDRKGFPLYDVVGVELPTPKGLAIIDALAQGKLPFENNDDLLKSAFHEALDVKNLRVTADPEIYNKADIVLMAIHLDVDAIEVSPTVNFNGIKNAARMLGQSLKAGALVIVETTVPPGTCEKIILPELKHALRQRGMPENAIRLAHSYERVMPGKDYLNSIKNFWRVYAGVTNEAAEACEEFLKTVINVDKFPMTRLNSVTASEIGKVLENSYRATNIAFIEEWSRFAEKIGVDIFQVIDAIRVRPTHSNIRQPGFGVGGYCLTKDPLLAEISAHTVFNLPDIKFDFCKKAVEVNRNMPLVTLAKVKQLLGGSIAGKKILLLGVSYRSDVADTRFSPSETFTKAAINAGATVILHDPLVNEIILGLEVHKKLPYDEKIDALVLAVAHEEYRMLDFSTWQTNPRPIIFDANRVLSDLQLAHVKELGFVVSCIGRG